MTHIPQSIALGPGGRTTSRLGFGCSSIAGGLTRRASLALLEAAFDAGIRHFDVAPMYGHGTAEAVVGEFVQRHTGDVTLTTKYGILPPPAGGMLNVARALVRPLANRVPPLRQYLIRRAGDIAQPTAKAAFTPVEAMRSLEASLRALRVERLDLFLLHDADGDDLQDRGLLRMLHDARDAGKIANFGVGSPARVVEELVKTHPEYCPVVQSEWSALSEAPFSPERFYLCHRTIAGAADRVQAWFREDATLCGEWERGVGMSLADPENVTALLLTIALLHTPGVVLFSSRKQERIERNVRSAADDRLVGPALRFSRLLRAHAGAQPGFETVPRTLAGAAVPAVPS